MREHVAQNEAGPKSFSTVSLFGINDLEGLKLGVFEEMRGRDHLGKGADDASSWVDAKWRKSVKWVRHVPKIGAFAEALAPIYFSAVKDAVICIDDLERRGSGLELRTVFGLASYLRDIRRCRVMFLFNRNDVTEADRSDLERYFEKTFDSSMALTPSSTECCEIAFGDSERYSLLSEYSQMLPIHNIRILLKSKRLFDKIEPLINNFHAAVKRQVCQSIVLLNWAFHKGEGAPDFSFVVSTGSYQSIEASENQTDAENRDSGLLAGYAYTNTDGLDRVIANAIESGVWDQAEFAMEGAKNSEQLTIDDKRESYSSAWKKFHNSFQTDEDEVVEHLIIEFRNHMGVLSCVRLNQLALLLNDLERHQDAELLAREFGEARADAPKEFWDRARNAGFGEKWAPQVAALMNQNYNAQTTPADLKSTLISLGEGGYSISALSSIIPNISEKELYELFMSSSPEDHNKILRGALFFDRVSNADEAQVEFTKRVKNTLKKIGSDSKINALRIRRWGVSLDQKNE